MGSEIGLYYPFIHFDDRWIKLALLYWDRIARIVPRQFELRDSQDVKRVRGELGVIVDSRPDHAGTDVLREFRELILQEAKALRKKYDVKNSTNWKADPVTVARAGATRQQSLAYVFDEKFGRQLVPLLIAESLAVRDPDEPEWVGMHPNLARLFMTLLAEGIAAREGYALLSDDVTKHITIGDLTAARLAAIALNSRTPIARQSNETAQALALTALKMVIPKNIASVPIKSIIKLRKNHPAELREFQSWIHGLADSINSVTTNGGPAHLKAHLEAITEKDIIPRMTDLKAQLKSVGLETVTGAVNLKVVAPTALAAYLSHPFLATGWVTYAAASQLIKQQREAKKVVQGNPTAYLMYAKERVSPNSMIESVKTAVRRFTLGV